MKPALRFGVFLAGALIASAAAAAQRPPPLPPGSWNVDWGDRRCALIRQSESSPPSYFAFQVVPGSYYANLRVVSRDWPRSAVADPERLTMSFPPDGGAVPGRIQVLRTDAGHAVVVYNASERAREAFAAAQSVRVSRDGVTLLEIPLPESGRALQALRECEEAVMREWGIDPRAFAAVRVPPRGNLASFVTSHDFPASALRRRFRGMVVFRLDLDRTGRVTDCRILESSGDEAIDATSCRVMRQRVQLEPALGHDGSPIPVTFVGTIDWRISGP